MTELSRGFNPITPLHCDALKQRVGRSIAKAIGVTKDVKSSASHKPTAGRAVEVPHALQGFPNYSEVFL
jgi:hypothetical protein